MTHSSSGKIYLITGGASLIGSHLADGLLAGGASEIRLLDNYSLGTPETIAHLDGDPRVKRVRGDILRLNEIIDAARGADGIFALAGFLTIPMAANVPLGVEVNTTGVVNTLEAARIAGVRRVVFASSVAAYGETKAEILTEDAPSGLSTASPISAIYGTTKLLGEALGRIYQQKFGVEFNAMRFSSVYGERQHERAMNANGIAAIHDQIRRGEAPVIVGDGCEVHDYIHVTDVAAGCISAMLNGTGGEVLNLVTGEDTSHTALVDAMLEVCGATHMKPVYKEDTRTIRSAGGNHLGFSPAKTKEKIGWSAAVPLREGLSRFVTWREAQDGVRTRVPA
ncbi:NAD-dependent epimerase/dehydratase family protein [Pararoseomonas indoligenes]|uniref:NAD-dependent epimerase/dehydratase family protein n=1 Tax=Roseomonas indoligenes TaxID=2820811 RepID=A0A940N6S8_9PROT|nr:NAD-dependent epimerase/dehydratase family protein [Pararoseomonas indoligenes]